MLICSCGTGLTACIDIGALIVSGFYDKCVLYDGSWIEYGNLSLEEIEKIGKE
jgi:thiosulfate/3-mercaptopyruvate sulfurtransferase